MSLKRGNPGEAGRFCAIGKSAKILRNGAKFLSTFPTGNQAQGLMKTGFLSQHQEERNRLQGCLWHFETPRVTKTRKVRANAETAPSLPVRSMCAPTPFSVL